MMSERRNAVPLNTIEACLGVIEARGVTIATLTRERDEARAMLAESKASLDRVGPIADECLQIAKTMAGSREEAAASERAAIVAMLERIVSARVRNDADDVATNTARNIRDAITRLDHHREPGKERGE